MSHGSRDAVVRMGEVEAHASAGTGFIPPHDVRLEREMPHRRLVVSMMRRFLRVAALHVADGAVLAALLYLLAFVWPPFLSAQPYVPVVVAIFLVSLNALSTYDSGDARRDRGRLFSAVALALLILGFLTVLPPRIALEPRFFLMVGVLGFLGLALERRIVDQLVRQAYVRGIGVRRAVMVGTLGEVSEAIRLLRDEHNIDQYVVGHLSPEDRPDPAALGTIESLDGVIQSHGVQEVVLTTSLPQAELQKLADSCFERGVDLFVIPAVISAVDCRAEHMQVGRCPMLRLHPARLEMPSLMVKRAFDLVMATLLLVAFAPLLVLLAIVIRMDSPGPVFFRQERVGLGGRRFVLWKFRSMHVGAEERLRELAHLNAYGGAHLFKLASDPRVTPVGRILRRMSLDELPQLFNVVRGEMSLVGPRPPLPSEVERYEPHHFARLSVIPGITGPWQVGGRNLITDFEQVVWMEREYIRSWSLLLDAKILMRTIRVVLTGEGAY